MKQQKPLNSRAIELDPEYYLLYLLRAEAISRQTPPRPLDALADIQVIIESPQAEVYAPFTSLGLTMLNEVGCHNMLDLNLDEFGFISENSEG